MQPLYMTSQFSCLCLCDHTHCNDDITHIVFTTISESTSTESLSLHPNYRSYNPHCMHDNTATICLTSYELHMTSHPLFMISNHTMTSHPLHSCHHTQGNYHCIHCSRAITYNVLIIPHLIYE